MDGVVGFEAFVPVAEAHCGQDVRISRSVGTSIPGMVSRLERIGDSETGKVLNDDGLFYESKLLLEAEIGCCHIPTLLVP